MTATHSVSGSLSSAIFTIIVSGADRNIPTGPNTQPQKTSETNTPGVVPPPSFEDAVLSQDANASNSNRQLINVVT